MPKADEYRKIADEYCRLAGEAKTDIDRVNLLDRARAWLEVASQEEKVEREHSIKPPARQRS
jgi:hypothetical protein